MTNELFDAPTNTGSSIRQSKYDMSKNTPVQ